MEWQQIIGLLPKGSQGKRWSKAKPFEKAEVGWAAFSFHEQCYSRIHGFYSCTNTHHIEPLLSIYVAYLTDLIMI